MQIDRVYWMTNAAVRTFSLWWRTTLVDWTCVYSRVHYGATRRDATRCDAFDRLESERASHSARIALFSRLPENREKRNRMCVHTCTSLPYTSREKTMRNGSVLPVVVQPRDIQQCEFLSSIDIKGRGTFGSSPWNEVDLIA